MKGRAALVAWCKARDLLVDEESVVDALKAARLVAGEVPDTAWLAAAGCPVEERGDGRVARGSAGAPGRAPCSVFLGRAKAQLDAHGMVGVSWLLLGPGAHGAALEGRDTHSVGAQSGGPIA
jgi:hypothetical protein